MNRVIRPLRGMVLLAPVTASLPAVGCGSGAAAARVELVARAPERGNWQPGEIALQRGKPTILVIRNSDVVSHGFYLPALQLHVGDIKAGDVREIRFTPEQAGDFPFYCSVWCGDYHMEMRGTLVVR